MHCRQGGHYLSEDIIIDKIRVLVDVRRLAAKLHMARLSLAGDINVELHLC